MNTQYHTTTASSALPVAEELVNVPSKHITGETDLHSKYTLAAWYLSQFDMQSILGELRDEIKSSSRGDIDGEIYTTDYKVYHIEAIHHFRTECEQRYDVHFGEYEPVDTKRIESLEVIRVTDENGKEYLGQRFRLNDYFKQNDL